MKKNAGFTLVEILIVVAIVGLLSSIAISNIQAYRSKARRQTCISNLKSVDNLIALWAINDGKTGAAAVGMSDLVPAYLRSTPYCPLDTSKQGYVLTTILEKPKCPIDPEHHTIE